MITIVSSPGHMATRWLAECFAKNDELLVTHNNHLVIPSANVDSLNTGNDVVRIDQERAQTDWPSFDGIDNPEIMVNYLEGLRKKHKKKRIVAIHPAPVSCGDNCKEAVLSQNGGRFVYLVREPIQKLTSQSVEWDKLDVMVNTREKKLAFQYVAVEKFVGRDYKTKSALLNATRISLLPFARATVEYLRHLYDASKDITLFLINSASEIDFNNHKMMKNYREQCSIFRFEDYTNNNFETLSKLYEAVVGEQAGNEKWVGEFFGVGRINSHRNESTRRLSSDQIFFDQWSKAKSLLFTRYFDASGVGSMATYFDDKIMKRPVKFPNEEHKEKVLSSSAPKVFFEYAVPGVY